MDFIVQTDAYDVGIGAVLFQGVGKVKHPIDYISCKFPERENKLTEKGWL